MAITAEIEAGNRFVQGFAEAWVQQDVARLDSLFTDDLVMYWNPAEEPLVGLAGLREYWAAEGDLQSDIRLAWSDPLVAGSTVVVEFWVRMTYKGTEASDPAAIARAHESGAAAAAEGRAVSGQLCVIAELEAAGRCRRIRQYQLGGDGDAEPPEWWGDRHAESPTKEPHGPRT